MSDSQEHSPADPASSAEPASPPAQSRKAVRGKTLKFIVVFMISVLVLLVGYETQKQSVANDWYLLQVARSTAWLLRFVGYSCTVGGVERFKGREGMVRASVAAWKRGEDAPAMTPPDANTSPLSAWEVWEYQAAQLRHERAKLKAQLDAAVADTTQAEPERSARIEDMRMRLLQMKSQEMGPLVSFVWKAGPERRLADAQKEIADVQTRTDMDESDRARRLLALRERVAGLEKEAQAAASMRRDKRQREDLMFPFIVVPDCGAIQSMAIFFAAILAFPAPWWRRLAGLLIGIPVLYWVNAFRLAFLAVIGAWDGGGPRFKFAHEYVWQGIYIVFVVALWMAWVELLVRRKRT